MLWRLSHSSTIVVVKLIVVVARTSRRYDKIWSYDRIWSDDSGVGVTTNFGVKEGRQWSHKFKNIEITHVGLKMW